MAPELMNGLRGIPFSNSSWNSELNAVPEGSLPTCFQMSSPLMLSARASANTFEILWIENLIPESWMLYDSPFTVFRHMPKWSGLTLARAGI